MNKYEKLKRKIEKIDERLDNIVLHNENANEYKKRYKKYIGEILEAIDKQMIPQSNGALLGLMRGISDYEEFLEYYCGWRYVIKERN